jgi:hypothetical protein
MYGMILNLESDAHHLLTYPHNALLTGQGQVRVNAQMTHLVLRKSKHQ